MTLLPFGQGLIASVIAAFTFASWIAIGSIFLAKKTNDDGIAGADAILVGSGITAFALAVFSAARLVTAGVVIVNAAGLVLLIARRERVKAYLRMIAEPYREAIRTPAITIGAAAVGLALWVTAISPPRNADAMRYHLAHIRQIVSDGGWSPIADYHYALPFGWSLSYLPFELLNVPQGAQLMGLGLFVIFVSSFVRALRRLAIPSSGILAGIVIISHPASLRLFTEASSDAYALFIILVLVLILSRAARLKSGDAAMLGFAALIGLQSRYQLGAAAVAALVVFVVRDRNNPGLKGKAIAAGTGAIAALILASPFYVANHVQFRNPVWPLFIDLGPGSTYADAVANTYSRSLTGSYTISGFLHSLIGLATTAFIFPLGFVLPAIIIGCLFLRRSASRLAGFFGAIFLAEWAAIQPSLYPRFVLMMVPVGAVCLAIVVGEVTARRGRIARMVRMADAVLIVALAGAFTFINRDSFRYAITGNEDAYHRHTWFYRAYQWVNSHTPADARFAVIVSSAQTYYLDRPYRRADPWLTGEIDWSSINTGGELDSLLAGRGYDYVIYENRDWHLFPQGRNTEKAISEALQSGLLRSVASFPDTLYTSRFRGTFRTTTVEVLARDSTARTQ